MQENTVKKWVRDLLKSLGDDCWWQSVAPGAFGGPTVDFVGFYRGMGFAVETKRPDKLPTSQQLATLQKQGRAGALTFLVRDKETFALFKRWIDENRARGFCRYETVCGVPLAEDGRARQVSARAVSRAARHL